MNVFSFTGHLGKDAEARYLPSGMAVCSFSVAVTSGYGDKEKTTWTECAIFGKRAEGKLPTHLTTGQKVAVSGEAALDQWVHEGKNYSKLKVVVNTLDLIGVKPEQSEPQQTPASRPQDQQQTTGAFDSFDDDIAF